MQSRQELEARLINRATLDESFRALLLENPHEAVREETGTVISEDVDLAVHEEGHKRFHLVLPPSDRISERDLEKISGGTIMGY